MMKMTICKARRQAGFTLMELTMVIAISGLLAGFSAHLLVNGVETYDYMSTRKEALENSRLALQRIVKEVRQALDATVIQKAAADSLRFVNINNQSVQIRHINQSIEINGQVLIDEVTAFGLTFFNGSGTQLNFPIANTSSIWRIRISFVRGAGDGQIALRQDIVPRNFRN